jgi:hypothetical protein
MSDLLNTGYTFGQWAIGATVFFGLFIAYNAFVFLNEKWWRKLSFTKQEQISTTVIISVLAPALLILVFILIIYVPVFIYAIMGTIFKW